MSVQTAAHRQREGWLTAPGANCTLTRPVGLDQVAGPPAMVLTSDLGRSSPPVADMRPNAPGPTELLMNAPCIGSHRLKRPGFSAGRRACVKRFKLAASQMPSTNAPRTQVHARAGHR